MNTDAYIEATKQRLNAASKARNERRRAGVTLPKTFVHKLAILTEGQAFDHDGCLVRIVSIDDGRVNYTRDGISRSAFAAIFIVQYAASIPRRKPGAKETT
jgi:hypothetical protein